MIRQLCKIVLFSSLLALYSFSASAGVLLQGFYWDAPSDANNAWWDRLASQSSEIARAGFTAVWLPPVLKGASGGYSNGYDPYDDYDIGSKDQRGTVGTRWGTRQQLTRAVAMLRANGLQVYLDQLLTHRNGDSGDKSFLYADAFGKTPGGRFQKSNQDFEAANGPFGRSFSLGVPYVREGLLQAGDWVVKALDVQGYRIDHAKGVPASFLKDYINYGALKDKLTIVEYWSDLPSTVSYLDQTNNVQARAFDFPLWNLLKDMGNADGFFDMRLLVKAGLNGLRPDRAVTFVENHDTDKDHPTRKNKHMGYAYILTSEGYPSVFWKDYFEYGMRKDLDNLIWIHETLAKGGTEIRWSDEDLLIYERTGKPGVLTGLNDNTGAARTERVQTQYAPGTWLHDYTGHQPDIQVDGEGKVTLTVGPNNFVAYSYKDQRLTQPSASFAVTQEFAGATDLDIAPANNSEFRTIGRIYVEADTEMKWDLNFDHDGWGQEPRFVMQILTPDGQVLTKNDYGPGTSWVRGATRSRGKGWYTLEVRTSNAPREFSNFWWRQSYQAPKEL